MVTEISQLQNEQNHTFSTKIDVLCQYLGVNQPKNVSKINGNQWEIYENHFKINGNLEIFAFTITILFSALSALLVIHLFLNFHHTNRKNDKNINLANITLNIQKSK